MSRLRWLVGRLLLTVLSLYLVMTITFGFVTLTADPSVAVVKYNAAASGLPPEEVAERVQEYRESKNLDEPVLQRYGKWLVQTTTLDWGRSFSTGQSVSSVLIRATMFTAAYLVPALVLAVLGGLAIGFYSGMRPSSLTGTASSLFAYVGFGIPNFLLAWLLLYFAVVKFRLFGRGLNLRIDGLVSVQTAGNLTLAAIVVATSILAGQLRFTRMKTMEYRSTQFVKLLRSNGAGTWRIVRHLFRNAAGPLLSLTLTELVNVLLVTIIVVESIFDLPGLGTTLLQAVTRRDLPLLVGTAMFLAFLVIGGSLVQDLVQAGLDPRVGEE